MARVSVLLLSLLWAGLAQAKYTIVVVADEAGLAGAGEVESTLRSMAPFNEMGDNLAVVVRTLPERELGCASGRQIT